MTVCNNHILEPAGLEGARPGKWEFCAEVEEKKKITQEGGAEMLPLHGCVTGGNTQTFSSSDRHEAQVGIVQNRRRRRRLVGAFKVTFLTGRENMTSTQSHIKNRRKKNLPPKAAEPLSFPPVCEAD